MLSQRHLVFATIVTVGPFLGGCGDGEEGQFEDVTATPLWVVGQESRADGLVVEPGRGDTLLLLDDGVSRLNPNGEQLFRKVRTETSIRDATFTSQGTTIIVGTCFQPFAWDGEPLCAQTNPQAALQGSFLIELTREGDVVRSLTLDDANGSARAEAIVADGDHVHIAGTFSGEIDLGDGPLRTPATSLFHARLDANWSAIRSERFGGSSGEVDDIAVDANTGDVLMVGTFRGNVSFGGINLTNGPNGDALFLYRASADGAPLWAKHFLGQGEFNVRFADDGSLYVFGRGRAPLTSLGGNEVIDGPFATKLGNGGEHQWTWRAYDAFSGAWATVDRAGRIVAMFTEQRLVTPAVDPPDWCDDGPWTEDCYTDPAEYSYRRTLAVMAPDGRVLHDTTIAMNSGGQGRLAIGPGDSIIIADAPSYDGSVDFGTGPRTEPLVVARLALVPE